jgi:hypothetical protein
MTDRDITGLDEFKQQLEENIEFLSKHVDKTSDVPFATSLCDWYEKRSYLSDKQMFRAWQFWCEVNEQVEREPSRGIVVKKVETPVRQQTLAASIPLEIKQALVDKFAKAGETLKYPSVKYYITLSEYITFYRTGPQSKAPGGIGFMYVKYLEDYNPPFKYYIGMMTKQCNFYWNGPNREVTGKQAADWQDVVCAILLTFDESMKINGKKFCYCCFCGRQLETKESLAVGYGPICAGKWGLPWGDSSVEEPTLDIGLGDL